MIKVHKITNMQSTQCLNSAGMGWISIPQLVFGIPPPEIAILPLTSKWLCLDGPH